VGYVLTLRRRPLPAAEQTAGDRYGTQAASGPRVDATSAVTS
jgi:hypothetical protein